MQHHLSLTPATKAVLDALRELGQANIQELAEKSGKARSTTDKALKTLADTGVIVAVDADTAEGTTTRWTLADGIAADVEDNDVITDADLSDADLGDADLGGSEEQYTDDFDTGQAQDGRAANDSSDGQDSQPDDESPGEHNDQDVTDDRDADEKENSDDAHEDVTGDGQDSDEEVNSHDDESDDSDDDDADDDDDDRRAVVVVQASRPGDRKVMTIKAVLAEYGDGATLEEIVAESGIGQPTVSRLLTAMEQADAARRLPGTPGRWIAGPTKAAEVDPNPQPSRCPLCFQVIKGLSESPEAVSQAQALVRPDATLHIVAEDGTVHTVALPKPMPTRTPGIATVALRRTGVTVNADGHQPFAKGELEKLTIGVFKANPGQTLTPQEIATAIGNQLGRTVSSGAVRNNCGKLGAAGHIVMVSDSPWSFVYPTPSEDGDAGEAAHPKAEQS